MTSTFFFSSILFYVEENCDLFQIIILQNMPIWYISFYFLQFLLFLWNILVLESLCSFFMFLSVGVTHTSYMMAGILHQALLPAFPLYWKTASLDMEIFASLFPSLL